jgi:hypothetical protein
VTRGALLAACVLAFGNTFAADAPPADGGTTIMGERETALGLVLTPWQDEGPAALDRPPALLDEAPAPVDAGEYARTSGFERDMAGWRRARVEHAR